MDPLVPPCGSPQEPACESVAREPDPWVNSALLKMVPMGSFAEVSIGDVLRAVGRYKPVAVSVLAILVALAVLPKPDRPPGLEATGPGGAGIPTPSASVGAAAASPAADDGAGMDALAGSTFSAPASSGGTAFSSFPSNPPFSGSSSSDFSSDDSSSSASPSAGIGPVTSGTSSVDTTGAAPAPKPLQVVGRLWAGRTGGTPLAEEGVPEGTLPVGARVQDDRLSFVRLAGDGTALGLAEDPEGRRDTNGPAKVQACKVTEPWSDGEGIPLQDAPAYDPNKCVEGTLSASGVWLFDLSSFSDRTDDRGFVLRPGAGAGLEWQVALRP